MSGFLSRLVLAGVLISLLVLALPGASGDDASQRPCIPRWANIVFRIWYGAGSIVFNGVTYQDGQYTSIRWGCPGISYSIRVGSGTMFRQWASDAGTFDSQTSTSTTFHQAGNSGSKVMVLNGVIPPTLNWGGYIGDVHWIPFDPLYGYSAALTFAIPTTLQYVSAPNGASDIMLVWTGLGGWTGSGALWQAGIKIQVNSGNSVTLQAFTDECISFTMCQGLYTFSNPLAKGDTVQIVVSYLSSTGVSYYIVDLGPTYAWTISGGCPGNCYPNFIPSLATGEVIVESAYATGLINPCGVPANGGYCVMPNFGTITVPNNGWGVPGGTWATGLIRYDADDTHGHYANPNYLTSGSSTMSGGFSWSWSTSPAP
jgi:hypothetical protein